MAPRAHTISLDEIAAAFRVTQETIRLWRKEGMPSRMESGRPRFDLADCISWRRETDRRSEVDADAPSAKLELALKARADRLLRELELAERRRDLVPIGESAAFLEEFVASFAATAAGRLQRFERDIVRAKTAADARRVTAAIHISLMEGGHEFADALEAQPETTPPAPGEAREQKKTVKTPAPRKERKKSSNEGQ